jgi:hypothetical protein
MLLHVPTANNMAGWRPFNLYTSVNLSWVNAADGPTNTRQGYLSMSTATAYGSVAVDVPAVMLGPWVPYGVTDVPYVPEGQPQPPPERHVHYLRSYRQQAPGLAFSLWLRATTTARVDVAVALWAISEVGGPAPSDAGVNVQLSRAWQRIEVVHGPFPPDYMARCEVYVLTANQPIHIAGASLH